MSSLAASTIKLLFVIITKGFPLVGEVFLKDRNTAEFLSENKTILIMLALVILLAAALLNVRYRLGEAESQHPVVVVEPQKVSEKTIPKPLVPPEVPQSPPKEDTKPAIVPNRYEDTRDLIRKRLGEIE